MRLWNGSQLITRPRFTDTSVMYDYGDCHQTVATVPARQGSADMSAAGSEGRSTCRIASDEEVVPGQFVFWFDGR